MTEFEERLHQSLFTYLQQQGRVGERFPDAPDLEEKWESVGRAYLPDGIREYTDYPVVSLGWVMYIGMALAKMWDKDWEHYSVQENLYEMLRDVRGYDLMDEFVREEVLELEGEDFQKMEVLVGECARRTHSLLAHAGVEPGTAEAFHAYVAALHQLYLMGIAVELHHLGYKMVEVQN